MLMSIWMLIWEIIKILPIGTMTLIQECILILVIMFLGKINLKGEK